MVRLVVRQAFKVYGSADDQNAAADALMGALVTMSERPDKGVLDCAVDSDPPRGEIYVEMTVQGTNQGAALNVAIAALRVALATSDALDRLASSAGEHMTLDRLAA
jgi:hypothetical protein